jgi:hypothetical protein
VLGGGSASEPAVYNLRGLVLNGDSALEVTGPVVLNLGSSAIVNGSAGHSGHQEWLTLNLAAGGLTLNGGASFEGSVAAPAGAVVINGSLRGAVAADRLTVNGGGLLRAAP